MNTEPYSTIEQINVGQTALREAIAKLGPPAIESAQFWSHIANDPQYSDFHRRSAVFQLFRRHVQVGMKLSSLANLLERQKWLRSVDIQAVEFLDGKIPVELVQGDNVFVISVLPEPNKNVSAIYLRIHGKVPEQLFKTFILNGGHGDIGDATLAQIGFSELSRIPGVDRSNQPGRRPKHLGHE